TEGFYTSLAEPATERLGDAVVQAKRHYAESPEGAKSHYTLDIYNLLGDPALIMSKR
ncbi:C25 family cysteine peptidase, partial [Candidatus Electronema sp. PJ]|uniref:C25 family cysteine peptidase n=1 Tax=Candidatus Electronema sp. PJ TaxID=3401572 RepID=UPI003AA8AE17